MTFTSISDIKYSDAFGRYFKLRTAERSALVKSGVVAQDPRIAATAAAAGTLGKTVNLPFWNDLTGDAEVLADGSDLTPAAISAEKDVAVILRRGKAFGAGDIARAYASSDPLADLADQLAEYWARENQKALFASLKGVFADNVANDNGDLVLDITGEDGDAAYLSKDSIIYAAQKLGDAKGDLAAIAMHSAVEAELNTFDNAASGFKPSDNAATLATWNGKSVIMDDMCGYNTSTGVVEVYLFGQGAIAMNEVPTAVPLEADRKKLAGVDYVISRYSGICHLRGVAWTGASMAGASPTNSELENAANWNRVYEKKQVKAVKLIAKIG